MGNNADLHISTFEKVLITFMIVLFILVSSVYVVSHVLYTLKILTNTLLSDIVIMSYCFGFTLGIITMSYLIYIIKRKKVSTND